MILCRESNIFFSVHKIHRKNRARLARKQEMLELEKAKPSDTYDDPQDVEAIAVAKATMGNYMLKASPDYKVCFIYVILYSYDIFVSIIILLTD